MKVEPLDLPLPVVRATLDEMRRPVSVAVQRSKNGFNVGTIIRVAHNFAAKEIILIGTESYYKKSSMGMEKFENIVEVPTETEFLALVKERNIPLVAVERDDPRAKNLWQTKLPSPCLLLFGSENIGITKELADASDMHVYIEMQGLNNSLPVVSAASIMIAEWSRQHPLTCI